MIINTQPHPNMSAIELGEFDRCYLSQERTSENVSTISSRIRLFYNGVYLTY